MTRIDTQYIFTVFCYRENLGAALTSICSTWPSMSENAEFHTHLYFKWFEATE